MRLLMQLMMACVPEAEFVAQFFKLPGMTNCRQHVMLSDIVIPDQLSLRPDLM